MAGNEAQGFGNQPSGQFRQNALAGLGQPNMQASAPGQHQRGAWLTQQGYTGPLPGSPELMAARQAGEHPIMDWRMQNHPGGFQPNMPWDQPGWPGMGNGGGANPWQGRPPYSIPPNIGPVPPQTQGVTFGEPYPSDQNPWARRPNPLVGR
jgi:hypothetical protein